MGEYHNHFVVNSVGMWDGRKLEAKYGVYYALRATSDRICKEHGLSVIRDPQRHKTARSVYFAEKNGEPTRFNLMREALDKALNLCSSWSEMTTVLRKLGYEFECGPTHKYATIRPFRSKKCTRTFRLGPAYEKEAMRERLLENQRDYRVTQSYYAFLKPYSKSYARENPPTEAYYRKRDFYCKAPRITGYVSFFRAVAIVLGIAPMYEKEHQQPLSAECREACQRLDRYTAEMTLVEKEHLETPQDLQRYIARVNAEIDEVTATRSKVRNKQRNCTDPERMAELKKQCAACTAVLADLRKKKKTACDIIEDHPKLRELLESEFEARLENDPYLSEREKSALRQQTASMREEKQYERWLQQKER